jgi:long-chain acyl-CoA synthetase
MSGKTTQDLEAARRRLAADPQLGMGNFLWKALEAHPGDLRLIVAARPFETAWNERCDRPTLSDWARLAEEYARRYAGMGVGPRDPVGVYGDHGAKYLLHYLALTRLGAIPVLVNERMRPETAARYLRRVGVAGVFTDEHRRPQLRAAAEAVPGFALVEADFRHAAAAAPAAPYVHDPRDPVLITHSSGTTGMPKAVLHKHGPYFYPMARSLEKPRDPATWRAVSALPPAHNSAIGAVAIAVVNGEELILMADQGGAAAREAIREFRPTSVVAFPQTYVDLLATGPDPRDLDSVMMWINLGDAAHEIHIQPLMRFGTHRRGSLPFSGSQFVDGLGSSEMGAMMFSIVHTPGAPRQDRCVGQPQPWVDAVILDDDGARLPDGRPGRLAVKSPSLSAEYWNDSNLTYRSHLRGYFLTGDVAYRDELGRFHHLDRVSDTVATRQGPIHTLTYEETIMNAVDDLLDCAVVAVAIRSGEAYTVGFVVLRDGRSGRAPLLKEEICAALIARDLQPLDEVRIVTESEGLLVGVTGKVLKAELRASLRRELESRGYLEETGRGPLPAAGGAPGRERPATEV